MNLGRYGHDNLTKTKDPLYILIFWLKKKIKNISIYFRKGLFPSKHFYKGKLKTCTSLSYKNNLQPYLVYDLEKSQEEGDENSGGLFNPVEARFVVEKCLKLNDSGNENFSIGIITPYQRQVTFLKETFGNRKPNNIEIGTVDSYQGREKDIIIFCSVRAKSSNSKIGFLVNRQRLNVSLTRAKYALYVVCHADSLKAGSEDWKRFIEDASQRQRIIKP